jgi:prepilin-type N-terminal cleavage/methylation domain-containing protein
MLMAYGRHGFTLAEVMLSLSMVLVVAGAIYNLLVTTQRLTRLQGERVSLQSSVRAGSLVIAEELRELSTVEGGTAEQNDIIAFGPSTVTYRAMRGIGFICHTPSSGMIRIARSSFSGYRDPQAGRDEAHVFIPGNAEAKDSWVPVPIVGVATAAACPGGLGAGITLAVAASGALGLPEPGTPVRIMELMELSLYQSDGRSWLGARSVHTGEAIQPLIGPLTDAGGFGLEYLDATGAATADRTRIKSVRATVRGTTEEGGAGSDAPVEEALITQITLRNSSRP